MAPKRVMLSQPIRVKIERAKKTKEKVRKILRELSSDRSLTQEAVRTRLRQVSQLCGEMGVLVRELKEAGVGVEHLQHWENDDTESEAEEAEAESPENTVTNPEASIQ